MRPCLLPLSIALAAVVHAQPAPAQELCDWNLELVPGNGVRLFGADDDPAGGLWVAGTSQATGFPFASLNFVARRQGGAWVQAPLPQPALGDRDQSLQSIASLGPDQAVAVGALDSPSGNFSEPQSLRFDGASWQLLDPPQEVADNGNGSGFFRGVARTGDAVWALGGMPGLAPGGADEPLGRMFTARLDGDRWTFSLPPLFDGIENQGLARYRPRAIDGVAADDVWIGGFVQQVGSGPDGALLAHWDGSNWSWTDIWPLLGSNLSEIEAIAAVASDDVWAVGKENVGDQTRAVILHWDGTAWSRVDAPSEPNLNVALRTVVARSADDVYAAGQAWASGSPSAGYLLRFDGTAWSTVPDVEVADGSNYFASAIADDHTLWLAGLSNEYLEGLAQSAGLCGADALVGLPIELSVGAGGAQNWSLDAGPDQAGRFYVVLGSASGTQPGIDLEGELLPLVADAYTDLTLISANQGPFQQSSGLLDGAGAATAAFVLPAGGAAALVGLELHHAFPVLDPLTGSVTFASNAVPLRFVP